MHELTVLHDLVILLAVAIPVAALAHRARLPTVAGFLLAGLAIGPHGFALISRPETVSSLAELGVMLLLFTIGLEFSVTRIVRLGRLVLQGGVLQVAGTLVAAAIAVSVPHGALKFGREIRTPAMQAGLTTRRLTFGRSCSSNGATPGAHQASPSSERGKVFVSKGMPSFAGSSDSTAR